MFLLEGKLLSPNVKPSRQLLADLQGLPKGARIGIEWLKKEDLEYIRRHLVISAFDAKLSFSRAPYYNNNDDRYWAEIANFCNENGYEVVFLEDKGTFERYNEATIKLAKTKKNVYTHEHKDDEHYHVRLCRQNDREYRSGVLCREIHEMERDDKLLEAIRANNLDAAIVGSGHSDYWMFNKESIGKKTGIAFGDYSTEKLEGNYDDLVQVFIKNAAPDQQQAYEHESLERALRLIKTGRITDKNPDFVGIWDVMFPTQGYFEMFVQRNNNGKVSGTIEDLLGSAVFDGELTPSHFNFKKEYRLSVSSACEGAIGYRADRQEKEFHGYFYVEDFGHVFYMVEAQKENPITMTLRWHQLLSGAGKKPFAFSFKKQQERFNHPI